MDGRRDADKAVEEGKKENTAISQRKRRGAGEGGGGGVRAA